jgi:hypothetical protein
MSALYDGYIIKVLDNRYNTVWDAETHDMSLCEQIMDDIAQKMKDKYPMKNGGITSESYPVVINNKEVGYVGISYYGPFFLSDNDFKFLEELNTLIIIIGVASLLFSAFIDNIPYVATMLPVAAGIANILHIEPYVLYFGLLAGATLGGNLTPIGASANITALGILRKDGHEVSAWQFMKISVPFTLAAVITGYIMIWFMWR